MSESSLKGLDESPKILHLATHGFYCQGVDNIASGNFMDNPLLYSGLVFSDANEFTGNSTKSRMIEDGILTSLEASGLPLSETELVMLSACSTGLGVVKNGEGVFGLRRAFRHAGAQTIVMSMFPVPDQATRNLMVDFYENWTSGMTKSQALRTSALKALKNRLQTSESTHPRFCGGFVLIGNPD